ncbi:MAG: SCO family protein [Myxococcaceae bacterium]
MARSPLTRALIIGLAATLSVLLLLAVGLYLAAPRSDGPPADFYAMGHERRNGQLPVLWAAPEFSFTSQAGEAVTGSGLKGHVWIADFIFTRCTTVCPLITAQMTWLQRQMPDPQLRFISFSVDPEHDTQQALADYAAKWNRNDTRWSLLVTTPPELARVVAEMRVAVAPSEDPENPIIHSNLFMLVDQDGQVRGAYNSADRHALNQLVQDARTLLGARPEPTPAAAAATDGAALFSQLRCAACHDDARVAPPLSGLSGRAVKLEGGGEVMADAAYLKEALVTPGAHIVAGYLPLMPSYRQELTDAQVDALVKYISALEPSSGASPAVAAELVVDPICKMKVRAESATPHVEHEGKTVYFCSELCKKEFQARHARNQELDSSP